MDRETRSEPGSPIGMCRMVENELLPNGLRRMKFEQRGRIPDAEKLLVRFSPNDGRYVSCSAWMDKAGIGHLYMAWKE